MSRASKLTLLGTSAFAVVTVVFVHFQQDAEKRGVVRDMEQQRVKRERQLDFDLQRALEEEYRKEQTVRDVTAEMSPAEVTSAGVTTMSASPAETRKSRGLWRG